MEKKLPLQLKYSAISEPLFSICFSQSTKAGSNRTTEAYKGSE